jgi:hypothetical protein
LDTGVSEAGSFCTERVWCVWLDNKRHTLTTALGLREFPRPRLVRAKASLITDRKLKLTCEASSNIDLLVPENRGF